MLVCNMFSPTKPLFGVAFVPHNIDPAIGRYISRPLSVSKCECVSCRCLSVIDSCSFACQHHTYAPKVRVRIIADGTHVASFNVRTR